MIEPVDVQQIATAAILAGAIVFFGAGYAIFFALGRLNPHRPFIGVAHASYLALFGATIALAAVLQLSGWWSLLVGVLLIGYFIAPRFIWHLSIAVHESDDESHSEITP